jgi:hypothetical protein
LYVPGWHGTHSFNEDMINPEEFLRKASYPKVHV